MISFIDFTYTLSTALSEIFRKSFGLDIIRSASSLKLKGSSFEKTKVEFRQTPH